MRLLALVRREIPEHLPVIAVMTTTSALSIAALLWLVNAAAQAAAAGTVGMGLLLRFLIANALFTVSQNYVLITASHDVEGLLHRMRVRLFDAVRRTDLATLERIGRAALHSALIQETQTLARNVPMLVIGLQSVAMLAFLATDADIDKRLLDRFLGEAVDASLNMITVDGDTSTNDTVLILANGTGGAVKAGTKAAEAFEKALLKVCTYLARSIAADGEGATRLIEVTVSGAQSLADARIAARTIVGSPLVKTAVHGRDPNWGRVIAALGRSGVEFNPMKVDLYLAKMQLMSSGEPVPFDEKAASVVMGKDEVKVRVSLNGGNHSATAWGCDLSAEYVSINSDYTT